MQGADNCALADVNILKFAEGGDKRGTDDTKERLHPYEGGVN